MSVFDLFKGKGKSSDAAARAASVARITDQSRLAEVIATDPDDNVCVAALRNLSDQDLRAEVAMGTRSFNLQALEGIVATPILTTIAKRAASGQVREQAVARLEDKHVLARIAAVDPDPNVRFQARSRHPFGGLAFSLLKKALAMLPVAAAGAEPAEGKGNLETICAALLNDRRFSINAVLAARDVGASGVADPGPEHAREYLELFARGREGDQETGSGALDVVYHQIRVWRIADDDYLWRRVERRVAVTHDVTAWASSSNIP
jgi:hypothetical protein